MRLVRKRPRFLALCAVAIYVFAGLAVSDVQSLELTPSSEADCPTATPPAYAAQARGAGEARSFTVLQGNLWMLPSRPLLVPFSFAPDRELRLERLVRTVRACRPEVVLLQEVFEQSLVDLIARSLPEYGVVTSGESDLTGTVNESGLVTLTRLRVEGSRFHSFAPLPRGSKTIEVVARKGLLAVDVASQAFEGTIVNLHLYSSSDSVEAGRSRDQLEEVLDFVQRLESEGRRVLVGGDFNLRRGELERRLPAGWTVSQHGATYDPRNPYTVQGANDTEKNRENRRLGRGAKAIDFLLTAPGAGVHLTSRVLEVPLVSDHQLVHHLVTVDAPAWNDLAASAQ